MLSKVKLALRVSGDIFNDEVSSLIEAAKIDMIAGGVASRAVDMPDAMVERAIVLYAKANYGMANPDSEKYDDAYHNVREKLSLSGEHNVLE